MTHPSPTHLCLVSDQPVPSLTSLIDPALNCKSVLLAHAQDRRLDAEWLADALAEYHIKSHLIPVKDSYSLPACRADFTVIAQQYAQGLTVNITGGTKIMTIATWEIFNRPEDRLYYVDIQHDNINWLRPSAPPTPIMDRVKIKPYLASLGIGIAKGQISAKPLSKAERNAIQLNLAKLKTLNYKASTTDVELGGYWLEHYIQDEISQLAMTDGLIQDIAAGFKIDFAGDVTDTKNELDVFCLRDNTAYLFECKSGKAGSGTEAIKAIYKLGQLCDQLVGMRGRGIFVSTEILSPVLKQRAKQFGIEIIDRKQLATIRSRLNEIFHLPYAC